MRHKCSAALLILFLSVSSLGTALSLSDTDVDLLVGTPTGIKEPLDTRRFKEDTTIKRDFSEFIDISSTDGLEFGENQWSDAEDAPEDPDKVESQYLDLLSETEDYDVFEREESGEEEAEDVSAENEEEEKKDNFTSNSSDNIETKFKL